MDPTMQAQHFAVWTAIDEMAAQAGCSVSALARAAGMNSCTFNPSARTTRSGMPRWPTSSTLAAVLTVTGTSWVEFGAYVDAVAKGYVAPKERPGRRAA